MENFAKRYYRLVIFFIIFFGFLFTEKICFASSVNDNFENYNLENIAGQDDWSYIIGSNGANVISDGGSKALKVHASSTNTQITIKKDISPYSNDIICADLKCDHCSGYYFLDGAGVAQNLIKFQIKDIDGSGTTTIRVLQPDNTTWSNYYYMSSNVYHDFCIRFDQTKYLFSFNIGGGTYSDVYQFVASSSIYTLKADFYANSSNNRNFYIDNITNTVDKIQFVNPKNNDLIDLQNFYWEYNLRISSLDYWTKYAYLNVDLELFPNGDINNPKIMSIYRYPMTDFVPMATYDVVLDDKSSFPDTTGAYQSAILLLGVYSNGQTDLLDSDVVNFGVATSTYGYNSAWCSNLCSDLVATTSTAWWQFWNWNTDNLGGTIMCSGRYLICWGFQPHTFTKNLFNDTYEQFKTVFPFNAFFDIASSTENAINSVSSSTNQTFGLPMIRYGSGSTSFYILPLVNSTTLSNTIGSTNANIFRTTIGYLMYSGTATIIFLILW